jgi:hypothetical protein
MWPTKWHSSWFASNLLLDTSMIYFILPLHKPLVLWAQGSLKRASHNREHHGGRVLTCTVSLKFQILLYAWYNPLPSQSE